MIRSLVLKEFAQHWPALLLVLILSGLGFPLIIGVVALQEMGSLFEAQRLFLMTFVVFASMILGNRLVLQEYQSRTQLFLEGLPLTRGGMVAVKYLLGLTLLLGVVALTFVLLLAASRHEALTGRFVLLLLVRTVVYTVCVYSFFFLMGFLGRYRIPAFVVLSVGLGYLANQTEFEFARWGPWALVDERFAFEREIWPTTPILVTVGLTCGFVGLTFLLARVREGSIAALLAEKMSHREKVFLAVLLVCFLSMLMVFDSRAAKQPFDLHDAISEERDGVTVKVAPGSTDVAAARTRAGRWAEELCDVREYLAAEKLPPIFVTFRRDLDAARFERGKIERADGLLVRTNFTSADFDDLRFVAWLAPQAVVVATNERVTWEPNRWIVDGFGHFWVRREFASRTATLGDRLVIPDGQECPPYLRQLTLRAAYGAEHFDPARDLPRWLQFRERVGEEIAEAVAWSGLATLEQRQGAEACRRFLAAMLRTDIPADARAWLHDARHPWTEVLRREAGLDSHAFFAAWRDELTWARESLADELTHLPRVHGQVAFEPLSSTTRKATFHVTAQPLPKSGRFAVCYAKLSRFDTEVPHAEIRREEFHFSDGSSGELLGTYPRGSRLFATLAVRVEELGCDVISGWTRQEVP